MLAEILQPILLRRMKNNEIFETQAEESVIYVNLE